MKSRVLDAIARHKWRYAAFVAGFLLLVEPFAYLIKLVYYWTGNPASASLHKACFRMPIDWLFSGEFGRFSGRPFVVLFTLGVIGSAFFLGPVFCGWLCPVGASSECLSRLCPRKGQIDLSRKISPASLRYGFLTAFALLALATALPAITWKPRSEAPAAGSPPAAARPVRNLADSVGVGGVCCRYCPSSVFERLVSGVYDPSSLKYWHSGAIMTLGGWLVFGGIFWKGGRGWCLYGCPLGAVANVFHWVGAKVGLSRKVVHNAAKCNGCRECEKACPAWAITGSGKDVDISRHTCNVCLECTKVCPSKALTYALK
jgi:ferredoxin-type protein NapH